MRRYMCTVHMYLYMHIYCVYVCTHMGIYGECMYTHGYIWYCVSCVGYTCTHIPHYTQGMEWVYTYVYTYTPRKTHNTICPTCVGYICTHIPHSHSVSCVCICVGIYGACMYTHGYIWYCVGYTCNTLTFCVLRVVYVYTVTETQRRSISLFLRYI